MHVHLRRAGAVALLAVAGIVGPSACVANESSLFIRACLAIPRDSCLVQASINSAVTLSGAIDGAFRDQYTCAALFENQLVQRGDGTKLRTETSRISVYEADVQVLDGASATPSAITQFTVPVTGFADPGTGNEPGVGLTNIEMIDPATIKKLTAQAGLNGKAQVVVSVYLHGRTLGGQELVSNEFKFPIDVYGGRLCQVPSDGLCVGSATMVAPDCLLGQDAAVDCRAISICSLYCTGGMKDTATCPSSAPPGYSPCCG